jgi:hypothetical protein
MTTGALFSSFDWQHSALLGGAIFGGIIVGIGILMESEKWSLAAILVLTGVVIEPIFTIGLFIYDEHLSRGQNEQIILLEKRLAARSLTNAQVADIIEQLKPFAGQHFDIVTYWRNPESLALANRIYDALIKAGWLYDKPPSGEFILGVETGVVVLYDKRAGEPVVKAVKAFTYALLTNDLYAAPDPQAELATPPASEPVNTKITINVGIKP